MNKPAFHQHKNWRIGLIITALLIVSGTIWYNNHISYQVRAEEEKQARLTAEALQLINQASENQDLSLHISMLEQSSVPMMITDEDYNIIEVKNYSKPYNKKDATSKAFFINELELLKAKQEPIHLKTEWFSNYVFYKESALLNQLQWYPYIQLISLCIFIFLAYLTFSYSYMAEQERVWVGMAKETAHQLGTPISSLIGWVAFLKASYPDDENIDMVSVEIEKDIDLLSIVSERFSKIGARPELQEQDVYALLQKHLDYIKQRASRKIQFDFPEANQTALHVHINPLLFDWVIENLLKNALDAMGKEGEISASVQEDKNFVIIDIQDTGKGIQKKNFKKIFEPGFSTKTRGWGLGLSLSKRIVENYHNGKIFVKNSAIDLGTTFRIKLPK